MKANRSILAVLFASALVLPSCGGDNPGVNFTIQDDLDDSIYVYDFDEGTVRARYFSGANTLVGEVPSPKSVSPPSKTGSRNTMTSS